MATTIHFADAKALAAKAWNLTKSDEDVVFAATSADHQAKLTGVVEDIVKFGRVSGTQGLERFEAYVIGVAPAGSQFASVAVAKPSAEFVAAAAKRRDDFNAKETELLATELNRVEAENAKLVAKQEADEKAADAKVAAAIAADKPKPVVVPTSPIVPVTHATV